MKSLREGKAQLKDSFAHIRDGEAFLVGAYIAPYDFSRGGGHEPERTRKLLLNRREIDRLGARSGRTGSDPDPTSISTSSRGRPRSTSASAGGSAPSTNAKR